MAVNGGTRGEYVRRYNADGSLDSTFAPGGGPNGTTTGYSYVAGPGPAVGGLHLDASGRILLGDGNGLVRLTAAGAADPTFGTNGRAAVGGVDDFAFGAAGSIYVTTSYTVNSYTTDAAVTRLTAGGAVDATFGSAGTVRTTVRTSTYRDGPYAGGYLGAAAPVAVQPDGKVVVGGVVSTYDAAENVEDEQEFAVERLNTTGSVDTAFGTGGVATAGFDGFDPDGGLGDDASVAAVAVLPSGNVLVAGSVSQEGLPQTPYGSAAAEFLPTGQAVPTFGEAGKVAPHVEDPDSADGGEFTTGLTVQADGGFVLTGGLEEPLTSPDSGDTRTVFFVDRYTAAGLVDASFGTGGETLTQVAASQAADAILAAGPDGRRQAGRRRRPPARPRGRRPRRVRPGPVHVLGATGTALPAVSGTVFDDLNGNGVDDGAPTDDGDPSPGYPGGVQRVRRRRQRRPLRVRRPHGRRRRPRRVPAPRPPDRARRSSADGPPERRAARRSRRPGGRPARDRGRHVGRRQRRRLRLHGQRSTSAATS